MEERVLCLANGTVDLGSEPKLLRAIDEGSAVRVRHRHMG